MKKIRILILDDSDIVLNAVSLALMEAGFEVMAASSLAEFDRLLSQQEPDIILTDIMMPEISGDSVCRVLKTKYHTQNIPVIIFSTMAEAELAQLAQRAGADGYVSKSAGIDEIVARIRELTEQMVF